MPRIPLGDWIDTAFDWLKDNLEPVFDGISAVTETAVDGLASGLLLLPAIVMAALFAVLGGVVRSVRFGVVSLLGLLLIIALELWVPAMETLALILVATLIAVLIGVPVGIAAARNDRVSAAVRPVLDFMQTMPGFVYLIPAVTFFSIGVVPGVVTTIIFALPPGVRLTELGIRQVDPELVEAGHAFGSPPGQILRRVQLPLALPTIMAGINQVIMLALSMAVIAGLIGAGGLGGVVVSGISRLDIGLGFEAGLAVVVLAVYLDRLTGALGQRRGRFAGFRTFLGRGSSTTARAAQPPAQQSATPRTVAPAEAPHPEPAR
ncbi:ABC transporter permease subunit [Modestobacter roseus]|nr:ABC transporter permease subunit [Modestobacter roseus]